MADMEDYNWPITTEWSSKQEAAAAATHPPYCLRNCAIVGQLSKLPYSVRALQISTCPCFPPHWGAERKVRSIIPRLPGYIPPFLLYSAARMSSRPRRVLAS